MALTLARARTDDTKRIVSIGDDAVDDDAMTDDDRRLYWGKRSEDDSTDDIWEVEPTYREQLLKFKEGADPAWITIRGINGRARDHIVAGGADSNRIACQLGVVSVFGVDLPEARVQLAGMRALPMAGWVSLIHPLDAATIATAILRMSSLPFAHGKRFG